MSVTKNSGDWMDWTVLENKQLRRMGIVVQDSGSQIRVCFFSDGKTSGFRFKNTFRKVMKLKTATTKAESAVAKHHKTTERQPNKTPAVKCDTPKAHRSNSPNGKRLLTAFLDEHASPLSLLASAACSK